MISRFDLAINLFITDWLCVASWFFPSINPRGALPYVGDIDMCHCEGYGLLWNSIYKSESFGLEQVSFPRKLINWIFVIQKCKEVRLTSSKFMQLNLKGTLGKGNLGSLA